MESKSPMVNDLKKELKRIYIISDIRANNPYLESNNKSKTSINPNKSNQSKSSFKDKNS